MVTKIFLDGGNPQETADIIGLLGRLDGQTTNPTLIAKNPDAATRLASGKKFSPPEIYSFYRDVAEKISALIPDGSVSIEVYADEKSDAKSMLAQGKRMFGWIPNAHIKFPVTTAGLMAAAEAVKEGMRVNLTLCFSEAQAAAVYAATAGAVPGQVFVSPFIGRLDDSGENGMDLVENILRLYKNGDGHVAVLAASIRNRDHLMRSFQLGADIVTAPYKILAEWAKNGSAPPSSGFSYQPKKLRPIPYDEFVLEKPWQSFDIAHPLTAEGIAQFSSDWNALIAG